MTVDVVVQSIIDENFIERRPIFSEDGNNIYVIDRDCVKEFSVQTSECCCTFFQDGESLRKTHSNIVGIAFHENYLYACTSNLTFLKWSRKGELILTAKRESYPKCKPFDLTIVDYDHDSGSVSQPQLFAFVRDNSQQKVQIQTFSLNFQRMKSFVYTGVPDPKLIALGCVDDRHFVVTALARELLVYDLEDTTRLAFTFSNSVSDWAVVRTVPHVDSIAAGDKKGRVLLYQHIFEETRKRKHNDRRSFVAAALYHWHAHPVNDIAFSPSGTQMYTGSEEKVLVRWNVRNPNIRDFAPRLQSSIQHIVVSPCNTTVSVSLVDNALALVSAQMQLHHLIQKLTWYLEPADSGQHNILPARMCYDPNSRCVVMNGRHGHLQFISLTRQELQYSMDICECNYIREPKVQLHLMQVVRVAVSQDGRWMATVEMRDDRQTAREVLMKMWQYDDTQRRFVMNTCINLPHYDYAVTAMRFQPTRSLTGEKRTSTMLVTSGEDRKFRVWTSGKMLVGSKGEYTTTWTNDRVGFYRDKEGGAVAFSYDGSVLAVGFGASLTVWDSDTVEMSASLTRGPEPIKFIEFEQKPYSHMVVTASTSTLQVWDLLSLSVVWCVKLNVTALTADPLSEHFAAFTADNQLFVFKTEQRMPVVKMAATNKMAASATNKMAAVNNKKMAAAANNMYAAEDGGGQRPSPPPVMAAIFVPRGGEDEGKEGAEEEEGRLPSWMEKSKLYYVTQSQELLAIDVKSSTSSWQSLPAVSLDDSSQALRGPYALLTAKKVRQDAMDEDLVEDINQRMGNLVEQSTRKLLSIPIHAVPHISLLCEDFLACQLSAKHEFPDSLRLQEMETEVEEKMAEKTKKKKKKKKRKEITNGNVNEIIDDVALENLFSIDTSPGADLNMDLE